MFLFAGLQSANLLWCDILYACMGTDGCSCVYTDKILKRTDALMAYAVSCDCRVYELGGVLHLRWFCYESEQG